MTPSALSAAALQRGGTIQTICPACGVIFGARSMLAVYCSPACKSRAKYYRSVGKPIPTTKRVFPKPIRLEVVQPELLETIATEERIWQGTAIQRRQTDGFVNATAMAKANGKHLPHYLANERTREYLQALSSVVGIPTTELLQIRQGGTPALQGTWIHPRLAIDLARWISPAFAVWMDGWFLETLSRPTTRIEPQLPKLPPSGSDILIRAKTRQEAAQVWADALEKATASAIRRMYSTRYRPDNANRSWIYYSHLPV